MPDVETKKRILVVDDEPRILSVLRIQLRHSGYDVITSTSGAQAIDIIRCEQPNAVLLDIIMPGMNGLEVLDRARAFSSVPIIAFTAQPDLAQAALDKGANDFIAKPFNWDELTEKLKSTLGEVEEAPGR